MFAVSSDCVVLPLSLPCGFFLRAQRDGLGKKAAGDVVGGVGTGSSVSGRLSELLALLSPALARGPGALPFPQVRFALIKPPAG